MSDMSFSDDMNFPDPDPLPFPWSYWVLPGRFMAGQYPGSPDRAEMQDKLERLLDIGIDFILNLMTADERDFMGRPFVPYQAEIQSLARHGMASQRDRRRSNISMNYGITGRASIWSHRRHPPRLKWCATGYRGSSAARIKLPISKFVKTGNERTSTFQENQ